MTTLQLTSKLVLWSKGSINIDSAFDSASRYKAGILGDGLIKDYFNSINEQAICAVPDCLNIAVNKYCQSCLSLDPTSKASELFITLADLLKNRQTM